MNIKMLKAAFAGFIILISGFANATLINFEDIYSDLGEESDPGSYYFLSHGVTFSGDYYGVNGGVSNGDVGNWDFDGTNGSAYLGNNRVGGVTTTMSFTNIISSISFDLGENFDDTNIFSINLFLGSALVDSQNLTVIDNDNGTGTWETFNSSQQFDYITITGQGSSGWGLDNIEFTTTAVPEPSTLAIFALGLMGLASRRLKKTVT